MFLPANRKFSWQDPPIVSMFLFLSLFACYFAWQANDDIREQTAVNFYLYSSLPDIEIPLFLQHLKQQSPGKATLLARKLNAASEKETTQAKLNALRMMSVDGVFQQKLRSRKIVSENQKYYQRWFNERIEYEKLLSYVVKYQFAYKPANPDPITLITHMFIHDNIIHLVLNAVMLLVFGLALEILIGRFLFFSLFIASGMTSAYLLSYVDATAHYWNIGASGALAGLVGAYVVIFFKQKIRFFYTLGIYFGYITAPAIALLPVWFLFELADYYFFANNTSNLSHMGGLVFGICAGLLINKFAVYTSRSASNDELNRHFEHQYQQALTHVAHLEFTQAHRLLSELYKTYPANKLVLRQLFNLEKIHPESEAFHAYAHAIFSLDARDPATQQLLYQTYIDYRAYAKPQPQFTTEQLIKLSKLFANPKHLDAAEKILDYLLTNRPDNKNLPDLLYAIIRVYLQLQLAEKLNYYANLLQEKFPDSQEAKLLATL